MQNNYCYKLNALMYISGLRIIRQIKMIIYYIQKMSCPKGYKTIKQINKIVQLVENSDGKKFFTKEVSDSESQISTLMAKNHVGPYIKEHQLCKGIKIIIIENFDGIVAVYYPKCQKPN